MFCCFPQDKTYEDDFLIIYYNNIYSLFTPSFIPSYIPCVFFHRARPSMTTSQIGQRR